MMCYAVWKILVRGSHVKYVAIVIMLLGVMGCDPVKNLDWDRTAKEQRLRIGNRVKVDGIRWGLAIYEFRNSDNSENLWFKKTWDTTLNLSIYNPDEATNENNPISPINPNAPIGTVICTIYNPTYHPILKELRDAYPDAVKMSEMPAIKHRFEVIGRIHSFKRNTIPNPDDTKPDFSLTAVRIHVENLTLKE